MLPSNPEESEPIRIPIEDVFDLHTIQPRDTKPALEAYLDEAFHQGLRALRIIHGRGTGVQREMVRTVLSRTPFVVSFKDAPAEAGGWGATIVSLGEKHEALQGVSEIPSWIAGFDANLNDATTLVQNLNLEQFNWRTRPGSWSVGECLDHLAITDRLFAARLSSAIDTARKSNRTAAGPFRYSMLQAYFLRQSEPPPKFRVPAPRIFKPAAGHYEPAATLEEFRHGNRHLARLAAAAEGLDLANIKVPSPVSSLWQWSIGIVLPLCAAHERRHLSQARAVRSNPAFPR